MQPSAAGRWSRFDERLKELRGHRTLGRPIRFYLRRREQVLYLVIGAWNTLFGYVVWVLLQSVIGDRVHYLVVVLVAWPIALLNAYLGYHFLVFESRGSVLREFPRFSIVYILALVANVVVLPIALALLPTSIYIVQALFALAVVVCSYVAHKYFSFAGMHAERAPAGRPGHPSDSREG